MPQTKTAVALYLSWVPAKFSEGGGGQRPLLPMPADAHATCFINHGAKYRKQADFDASWSRNLYETWHGWLGQRPGPHSTWWQLWWRHSATWVVWAHAWLLTFQSFFSFSACASSSVRAAMINCSAYNGTYLRHNNTCLPVSPVDDVIGSVTSLPVAAVDAVMSPTDDFFQ